MLLVSCDDRKHRPESATPSSSRAGTREAPAHPRVTCAHSVPPSVLCSVRLAGLILIPVLSPSSCLSYPLHSVLWVALGKPCDISKSGHFGYYGIRRESDLQNYLHKASLSGNRTGLLYMILLEKKKPAPCCLKFSKNLAIACVH